MGLHAILKHKDNELSWLEEATDSEIEEYKDRLLYIADDEHSSDVHACNKSVLYDDMTGYQDTIQREEELKDDEFYVVLYNKPVYFRGYRGWWELSGAVDFGVTKENIIQNVLDNKYVEGAWYFTIGQMMKTTLDYQNGAYNE